MSNILQKCLAHGMASRTTRTAVLLLLAGASVLTAAGQSACTVTVLSTADTGTGSLRDAINNASPGDTICVTATGTITLGSSLSIYPGLTITGPGAPSLTLSGNSLLLPASDSSTAPITISKLTVANSAGAGITVGGGVAATLSAVVVSGNQASGINNSGTLTIVNSTITNNVASQNPGAGIYNQSGGTLTLTNTIVSSNASGGYNGGGLENQGTATITGGLFLANTGQNGAAIDTGIVSYDQGAVLTVSGTSFLTNSAVGYSGGGAVTNEYNYENSGEGANVANITGATFSGNSTRVQDSGTTSGGAIYNGGQMTVRESTFSGNSADGPGGAIYSNGTLTLVQDTITANTSQSIGGGLSQLQTSETQTLTLVNTIIAGNTTDDCDNCGTIPAGNLVGGTPMLGPLANNGANVTTSPQTIMPLPGSPAIAGGVGPDNGVDPTDERGLSRTTPNANGAPSIDIGAVQTHYKSVSFLVQPPASVLEGSTLAPPVEAQVIEQDGNTLNYPTGVPVTVSLLQNGSTPSGPTLSGTLVKYPVTDAQGRIAAAFNDLSVATPGTYTLRGTTYPAQPSGTTTAAYNATSSAFTVTSPTPTTVSWSPASQVYGTPLPQSEFNATVSVNGGTPTACNTACSYTFTAGGYVSAGAVYGTGSYPVTVTYSGGRSPVTSTATLVITKASPALTLVTPPALLPGAVLSMANLHAVAQDANGALLPGTVAYSQRLGSPVSNGEQVSVTFTPSDTTDYVAKTAAATLVVVSKEATSTTLTATPNPALPGSSVVLSANVAPASGEAGVVPGTATFSNPNGTIAGQPLALDQASANFQAGAVQAFDAGNDYTTYSADFNGDGVADLLIVPSYGALGLELSVVGATPALGAPVSIANFGSACSNSSGTPTYAFGLAVGDANGDGLPDIAIACNNFDSTTTSLVLLVNQGGGNFTPSTITTLQNEYSAQIVFGDFNGDGKQDLVLLTDCVLQTSGDNTPCLNYMVGNGDGTFAAATVEPLNNGNEDDYFANLLTGDFNKDGKLDIAFIHYADSNNGDGVIEAWKNNGGTFGSVVGDGNCNGTCYTADATISAGDGSSSLSSLVSADFNVDGLPDLALVTTSNGSGSESTRSVALNTSTAGGAVSFPAAATDVQTGSGLASLVAADFDGDSIPDLAFYNSSDNTVRVLHGAGDGTFSFTAPNLLFTLPPPGQLDEGGRTPSPARAAAGRRGAKSAAARPANSYYNGSAYPQLAVGDANGDGTPDLLIGIPAVDQYGDVTGNVNGQQYVVNGASLAATTIAAPATQTAYTATAAPAVAYWAASSGTTTLGSSSVSTRTSLSLSPSAPYTYGQAITLSAQVVTAAGTPAAGGSVTFTEDDGTLATVNINASGTASYPDVLPTAGTHSFGASYSGATGEGSSGAQSSSITVAKAAPVLTWATPAAITTTTPLSATQLDATAAGVTGATLGGSFVYTPAAGTTLSAGSHTLSVTFTPTDGTDYTTATTTTTIQVTSTTTQTALVISPAAPYTYGQAITLSASVTNTGSSTVVQGGTVTFTATNSTTTLPSVAVVNGAASLAGVVLPAGTHAISAIYSGTSGEGNSSSTAQTITIAQAAPVLTWATPAAITTTTPLSATQLNATAAGVGGGTLAGTFVYTPAAGTTLSAGSHTLSVTFTPTDTTDYTTATTTTTIQVTSTTTQTALAISPAAPYTYGQAITLAASVTNTGSSTVVQGGTVTFTASNSTTALPAVTVVNGAASLGGVVLPAGTHAISASYSGTSGEGNSSSTAPTITVGQAAPVLTWPTPSAINTTTPLSATQLDASAAGVGGGTLPGTFVYTPAAGTLLTAGSHTLSVTFTPTDTANYSTATTTATIQVTSTTTQTALAISPAGPYTYGQPITLSATVTNTTGSTVVQGGTVTFSASNSTTALPAVAVVNGAASLAGVVLPAGTHLIGASYTGASGEGNSSATAQTITIAQVAPVLTWPTPAAITTTTPLSATQLDATAAGAGGATVAGTFAYTPAAGTTLTAGTHTLSVTFTPTDANDYTTATTSVQIVVANTNTQTTLAITPAGPYSYGTPITLSAAVTNTTGSTVVDGGTVTFTATNSATALAPVTVVNGAASLAGVVLPAGMHVISATYTGASGEGNSGSAGQTVTIAQFAPTLTWAPPAGISTTTPLGGMQLDAAAKGLPSATLDLPGTFTYTPPAGTTLSAGSHTLSVLFTPTDAIDYSTATDSVTIQVSITGTQTTLTLSSPSSTYGQPLTLTARVTNTTGTAVVNTGTVTFTSGTTTLGTPVAVSNGVASLGGIILGAGQPVIKAAYSGTAAENASSGSATATIGKATSVLTWPTPATISSTTPLSAQQLDATAAGAGTTGALPGTFTYTPAVGTTLTVGTHTLSVAFTPTDGVNYTTATAQVTINVVQTNTQTTLTVTPAQITYGQTVALSATVKNSTGSVVIQTGSVVFASDNVTLATVSVVNGAASLTGVSLSGGTHSLTASYTGADGEGISGGAQSITVAKFAPQLAWATPAQITTTTPLSSTQLDASATGLKSAALPGTFVYTPAAGTLLTAGAHTLSVTFTPTDTTDYATATAQVSIQVVAETITLTSISPTTTTLGTTPLPVTLTGSGFPASSVIRMNGATLPTTVISATQLGATVPAANLAKAGSLSFAIYDPSSQATSNALVLTVTAPTPTVIVTAPATVVSGAQPSITLTLTDPYPVEIDGVSTLTFTPAGPDGIDDPAVQFASGGRTYTFKIAAGDTAGPTEALQVGTVEGTVSVDTVLTAGGTNVTPPDLTTPTAIVIAPSAPTITSVTFTNVKGLLTVVVTGYSNTREMTQGEFVFTGPGAVDLATPGVIVPATSLFGTWYTNPDSDAYGSTFTYTQTFQLSSPTTNITGVTVTLSNTVGPSASVNSQ